MRSFLYETARSLYDRYGDDISSLTMVMPSRRAGLFFCDTLAEIAVCPLWQPRFASVGEIMQTVSGLASADNIKLVTELYKVYSRYHDEPFDSFYFWGGMLLGDFDQIDKYLIDADMLFSNIRDLKELESHSYLTAEQIEVITRFWRSFAEGKGHSEEKERFWAIWSTLGEIYHRYRDALLGAGLAYEGLVQRTAVEKIGNGTAGTPWRDEAEKFIVVGFNALTECEKQLFGWLDRGGRAEFFWDYDDYYTTANQENEAGLFLRDNIRRFPMVGWAATDGSYAAEGQDRQGSAGYGGIADASKAGVAAAAAEAKTVVGGVNLAEGGGVASATVAADAATFAITTAPASTAASAATSTAGRVGDRGITHNSFVEPKDITVVAAPSDVMQAKYVHTFLQGLIDRGLTPGKDTAIVLTDESLLLPVLHSIPESIENVNITMGYPLRQTTAYSFMERLLMLHARKKTGANGRERFYHRDITGLLEHPYIQETAAVEAAETLAYIRRGNRVYVTREKLEQMGFAGLFAEVTTWEELAAYIKDTLSGIGSRTLREQAQDSLRLEFFAVIIDTVDHIRNSLAGSGLEITVPVFTSLLRKVLQNTSIPYTGEPLEGIQIMGILETRNLDFENVLVLSANDDTFPGGGAVSSSFIPYNLRYAYGLPTPQHHEGVYAYYFYRLLQRTAKIDIAYSSLTDDKKTGEPSRYIYQLDYESPHSVNKTSIPLDVNVSSAADDLVVAKNSEIMAVLGLYRAADGTLSSAGGDPAGGSRAAGVGDGVNNAAGGRALSPTALYSYVECPLRFYFRYIARITAEDEITEEIDAPVFGTILHKAMELLYAPLVGVPDPQERIRALAASGAVEAAVDEAIRSEYLNEQVSGKTFGATFAATDLGSGSSSVSGAAPAPEGPYVSGAVPDSEAATPVGAPAHGATLASETTPATRAATPGSECENGGVSEGEYDGEVILVREIVCRYIRGGVLPFDAAREDFTIVSLEYPVAAAISGVSFRGVADRIDTLAGGLLGVVDYKTGARRVEFASVESLFSDVAAQRAPAVFQTMLYSLLLRNVQGRDVRPELYHVRYMNNGDFSPLLVHGNTPVSRFSDYEAEFGQRVAAVIGEMFDPAVPFTPCRDIDTCKYCDYRPICRR